LTVRNRAKAFAHRTRAPNRGPGFAVDVPRSNRPPGLTRGRGPGHQGAHQAARATATGHQVDGPRIAHQAARTRARSSGSSHQVDGHQVQAWRPTDRGPGSGHQGAPGAQLGPRPRDQGQGMRYGRTCLVVDGPGTTGQVSVCPGTRAQAVDVRPRRPGGARAGACDTGAAITAR